MLNNLRQSFTTDHRSQLSPIERSVFSALTVNSNCDLYSSNFVNLPELGHPRATGQFLSYSNNYDCFAEVFKVKARRFQNTVIRASRPATPVSISEPIPIRLSNAQLRLVTELMGDFQRKQSYLEGAAMLEVITSAICFLLVTQMLTPNDAVLSLTYDPSLVLRVDLGAGQGQLNISLTLGTDSDPSENVFMSLYRNGYEEWSWSGPLSGMPQQGFELRARLKQTVPNSAATSQQFA